MRIPPKSTGRPGSYLVRVGLWPEGEEARPERLEPLLAYLDLESEADQ